MSLRKSHVSSQGFTILELMLVVLLIGILASIIAPGWRNFANIQRLNTAQDQVYRAMQLAQSQAKRNKINWQASFREVTVNNDTIVQWSTHSANVEPVNASWNNFDSNIRLDSETTLEQSGGVRRIKFDDYGTVAYPPLGRVTLSLKNGSKAKRCVFVSTILGTLRKAQDHSKPKDGKYCY